MSELWKRIQSAIAGLNRNERVLLGVAGVLIVGIVLYLAIVQPLISASGSASRRAASAEEQVLAVQALRERYDEVNGRLSTVEQRIHGGPRGEIFTSLEQMASQAAVKIASMEPRTSPASEEYRETKVQVALKGVTLAQVVGYLHRIESAPQLLSIKSLRIRTKGEELLDVTFTVSSFEPISG